jgi:hypothetical protein
MRYPLLVLPLLGALLIPTVAQAQRSKRVHISDVHVGFKAGFDPGEVPDARFQYLFKAGMWTPVYVDISVGDEPLPASTLVVETTDSDDIQNTFSTTTPILQPHEQYTALTYTKPGSLGSEIIVTLRGDRGRELDQHKKVYDATALEDLLFVAVGTRLPGLRNSLEEEVRQVEGPAGNVATPMGTSGINRGRVAYGDRIELLPTHWFGYQPADLVVLSTANKDFVDQFMNRAEKARQDALSEWVRRGGHLVLTAGRNHDLAAALLQTLQMQSLPVEFVAGGMQLPRLTSVKAWVETGSSVEIKQPLENPLLKDKPGQPSPIEVAKLKIKPDQGVQVLINNREDVVEPLMVRMPFGMGQVTIMAFDLDQPPLSRWIAAGQSEFWKKFRKEMGVSLTKGSQANQFGGVGPRGYGRGATDDDLAGQLRNELERFPDVSNISFGWVALFIFLYILVVGPLDYFFLKKVVKRLELTWITFPAVVVAVSTVSYFTAYYLKGNDLLINKTDLVDIDVNGKTAYGHTWFTLFSPRIQHYTIGIEPAAPVWSAAPPDDKKASAVTLSWLGRPDTSYGGTGRARSQSLFRRAYSYTPDASGLEGVPIQVWSMKAFNAGWERPLEGDKLPFTADLHDDGQARLSGTITNNLSVPLEGAYLIHGRLHGGAKFYAFDTPLAPNATTTLALKPPQDLSTWPNEAGYVNTSGPTSAGSAAIEGIFRRLLFFSSFASAGQARNTSLRELDESWRLGLPYEVILFGRLPQLHDHAETVTQSPANPSRLWLGQLPAPNIQRPALAGTLKQDTYVRVFLPVQPPPPKKQ